MCYTGPGDQTIEKINLLVFPGQVLAVNGTFLHKCTSGKLILTLEGGEKSRKSSWISRRNSDKEAKKIGLLQNH